MTDVADRGLLLENTRHVTVSLYKNKGFCDVISDMVIHVLSDVAMVSASSALLHLTHCCRLVSRPVPPVFSITFLMSPSPFHCLINSCHLILTSIPFKYSGNKGPIMAWCFTKSALWWRLITINYGAIVADVSGAGWTLGWHLWYWLLGWCHCGWWRWYWLNIGVTLAVYAPVCQDDPWQLIE